MKAKKISEVIRELTILYSKWGDLPVYTVNPEDDTFTPIEGMNYVTIKDGVVTIQDEPMEFIMLSEDEEIALLW